MCEQRSEEAAACGRRRRPSLARMSYPSGEGLGTVTRRACLVVPHGPRDIDVCPLGLVHKLFQKERGSDRDRARPPNVLEVGDLALGSFSYSSASSICHRFSPCANAAALTSSPIASSSPAVEMLADHRTFLPTSAVLSAYTARPSGSLPLDGQIEEIDQAPHFEGHDE